MLPTDPPVCYWCGREIHGAECEGCWEQYTREKNTDIYDTKEDVWLDEMHNYYEERHDVSH